jgi:hypothetical protein
MPAPRTLSGDDSSTPTSEINPGILAEPETKIAAIIGLPGSDADRWKLISEYLQFRAILNDETETWRLVRWAKGYLIHDGELYRRSTLGIL